MSNPNEPDVRALLADIQKGGGEIRTLLEAQAKAIAEHKDNGAAMLKRIEAMEKGGRSRGIPAPSVPGSELRNGQREFSLSRALYAIGNRDWANAQYEYDVFAETAKASGKPVDERDGARVMLSTSDTAGGYLIPREIVNTLVPLLYSKTVVKELGATVMSGLVGSPVEIPKMTDGVDGSDSAEGDDLSANAEDLSFGQIQMTPKRATAFVKVSNRMLRAASPSMDAIIRDDITKRIARKVDRNALTGTGSSNLPLGVRNFANRNDYHIVGDNGGEITYDILTEMVSLLEVDDALEGSLAWLFHPLLRKKLALLLDADDRPLFTWDPSQGQPSSLLLGYKWLTTTNLPTDLTAGSGTALTPLFFCNWADLILGEWGGLMLDASNVAGDAFKYDQTYVRAIHEYDVAPRREVSFAVCDEIETV